jgi:hypothetical protein
MLYCCANYHWSNRESWWSNCSLYYMLERLGFVLDLAHLNIEFQIKPPPVPLWGGFYFSVKRRPLPHFEA